MGAIMRSRQQQDAERLRRHREPRCLGAATGL
jgi:hypothetical protein